jgi:PKD repeat protein
MSVALETYILTVLKMPAKAEFVTRLNNLSGLSGTPMSPLLTKWVQQNFGLASVAAIQNWSAGKFSPDMLLRWTSVFPSEFQGGAIRADLYESLTGSGVIPPVANFSGSPTTIYAGDTVAFTDLSTNAPTSWSWAFAGGTPATSVTQNPSVVYNTAGTYGVDLTASNIAGSDLESKPNYITVNFPYLLDIYGNAAAAYSVRKLRSAYAGNCLRVRRSSDNTETDIGFSNNFLNTSALTTFVGAGNGFVTKWYDQTGSNRDAIQTSAFNQPRIVNAGVLFTQNSLASINCYDSNRCAFNITEGGFGGNTILTNKSYGYAFVAARTAQTTATRRTLFSIASTNINSSRFYIGAIASSNAMAMGGKRLDTDTLESTSTTTHGSAFNLLTGVARYADAEAYLYKNGVLAGSKVPFQTAGATSNTSSYNYESYIGSGRGDVAGGIENGSVSEVVIYNTDKASDRAAIETNIKNYFSIV